MYPLLALIFFLSLIICFFLLIGFLFKPQIWIRHWRKIRIFCAIWFIPYFAFILIFTGPEDLKKYPPRETSPYKLPWQAGVSRVLSQGNRSFISHRGLHFYAWDFVMPNGTRILAAREGYVLEVEQSFSTIGLKGNFVLLRHVDGQISGYFHIQHNGALVKVGDEVKQGQEIAFSGNDWADDTSAFALYCLQFRQNGIGSDFVSRRGLGCALSWTLLHFGQCWTLSQYLVSAVLI